MKFYAPNYFKILITIQKLNGYPKKIIVGKYIADYYTPKRPLVVRFMTPEGLGSTITGTNQRHNWFNKKGLPSVRPDVSVFIGIVAVRARRA